MLGHRLRRWPNIETRLGQRVVFAWAVIQLITDDKQHGKVSCSSKQCHVDLERHPLNTRDDENSEKRSA